MRSRPLVVTLLPLAGYLIFSLVWLGRNVILHPRAHVLGDAGADKTIYMWSLSWWPWAIEHARDPFNANVIWAPHGSPTIPPPSTKRKYRVPIECAGIATR